MKKTYLILTMIAGITTPIFAGKDSEHTLEKVDAVKGIMHNQIDMMLQGHEQQPDLTPDKNEAMAANAKHFFEQANKVKKIVRRKNANTAFLLGCLLPCAAPCLCGYGCYQYAKSK